MQGFRPEDNNIMLDLETMSTESNAAILQIGAVRFDIDGVRSTFEAHISLESCQSYYQDVSASTILWWLKQSDAARKALIEGQERAGPLHVALDIFSNWVGNVCPGGETVKIWGNGAVADNVWLANAYKAVSKAHPGVKRPWTYHGDRCYRTWVEGKDPHGEHRQRPKIPHNALSDAEAQAMTMVAILNI